MSEVLAKVEKSENGIVTGTFNKNTKVETDNTTLMKSGNVVTWNGRFLNKGNWEAVTNITVGTIPEGFRPTSTLRYQAVNLTDGSHWFDGTVTSAGNVSCRSSKALTDQSAWCNVNLTWFTKE